MLKIVFALALLASPALAGDRSGADYSDDQIYAPPVNDGPVYPRRERGYVPEPPGMTDAEIMQLGRARTCYTWFSTGVAVTNCY